MEQSFDDLLNDAFSDDYVVTEVSVGFLENEDLDFENVNCDDKFEEDKTDICQENLPTKKDGALHQEATGGGTVLTNTESKIMYVAEYDDDEKGTDDKDSEDDFQGVQTSVMSMEQTPQEDFTNSDTESEEESSDCVTDEDDMGTGEQPGDLLMSVHCSDELCHDNKEDRFFAEGQPLALEGTETPEVRNEEQDESDMDEEMSYFGQVPEQTKEMMMMKGDGTEEDEQERDVEAREDSSDSECEHVKIKQEEKVLALCFGQEVESPYKVDDTLEFSEISAQNLQDLIAEIDTEEYVEKTKDFSGEEHQEAGESFADYPSDFSSCEYVEGGGQNQEVDYKANTLPFMERAATDKAWMRREEDTDQEGQGCLYSRDSEVDADRVMNQNVATEENSNPKIEIIEFGCDDGDQAAESDSYRSSDDDYQVGREDELSDNMRLENDKKLDDTQLHSESVAAFPGSSISDDYHFTNDQLNVGDLKINWDFNFPSLLLTTEDADAAETRLIDESGHPAEDINSYSVVQREDSKTTCMSYQGSLDDIFFFNTELEASGVSELGQLGDDEYEEERNWEQEKERIKAFYKFYDENIEEDGREERRIKVQFCADPLSQVIRYDSDRDSLSSSTEGEEDLSSAETSEEPREPDNMLQMEPAYDPPNTELPDNTKENDASNTQICTRKHKHVDMLKHILKMALVVLMGILMFWLATDQADWLGQIPFFQG